MHECLSFQELKELKDALDATTDKMTSVSEAGGRAEGRAQAAWDLIREHIGAIADDAGLPVDDLQAPVFKARPQACPRLFCTRGPWAPYPCRSIPGWPAFPDGLHQCFTQALHLMRSRGWTCGRLHTASMRRSWHLLYDA